MINEDFISKTIALLILDEGYKQYPYLDTKKNITIGIGKNLTALGIQTMEEAKKLYPNGMTRDESVEDCKEFILSMINKFKQYLPMFFYLDDARKYIIINMAYNVGLRGILDFKKMIEALKNNNYQQAYIELLNSKAAKELPERYKRLSKIMLHGQLQ